MNLTQIKPFLLYDFKSEAELVQEVGKLSQRFTRDRSKLDRYTQSEKSVSAYACFYALTNLAKLKSCLDKIGLYDLTRYELVDIGSGPGTFSLAALELNSDQRISLFETSDLMRQQAKRLIEGFFPDANIVINPSTSMKSSLPRLGIFGHSANEMDLEQIKSYITDLDLKAVLFIEPGTREFFSKMTEVRQWMIEAGYHIHFPCPNHASCPVEGNDWCHQYIKVSHDPEVERLCQLVKKDRRLLPLTLHYYSKESLADKRHEMAVVQRMLSPLKFAQPMIVCMPDEDGQLSLKRLEILYKEISKAQQKNLQKLMAGDTIEFLVTKVLNNGDIRAQWKCKTSQESDF